MPKKTTKQKEKVADFSKKKFKLGKGKQQASNATDTSYKARSIALPTQNPLLRSLRTTSPSSSSTTSPLDIPPTSSRGLTLPEVLSTLRHPNAGAKKDGLVELKDLLVRGAEGVGMGRREGEVWRVLRGVIGLINDEDGPVRKSLLTFLTWYLPLLPPTLLTPHLPLLLLQSSSALSHIYPSIRIDACRLLGLLLGVDAGSVVGSWPLSGGGGRGKGKGKGRESNEAQEETILNALILASGLGGKSGEGGAGGENLTPPSKLVVLKTMLTFIRAGLRKNAVGSAGAIGGSGAGAEVGGREVPAREIAFPVEIFAKHEGRDKDVQWKGRHPLETNLNNQLVQPIPVLNIRSLVDSSDASGWLFTSGGGGGEDQMDVDMGWDLSVLREDQNMDQDEVDVTDVLASLYLDLYPLLLSTLLESAPSAFSISRHTPSSSSSGEPDVNLSLISVIMDLTLSLAGEVLASGGKGEKKTEVRKNVVALMKKIGVYFPFGESDKQKSYNSTAELYEFISLSYASLIILLQPSPTRLAPRPKNANAKHMGTLMEQAFQTGEAAQGQGQGLGKRDDAALGAVSGWIVDILSSGGDALKSALSPHVYARILPVIWSLISASSFVSRKDEDEPLPETVLRAFMEHLLGCGSDTSTRRLGDEFVARMIMVHEARTPSFPFRIPTTSPCRPLLDRWLESIPRSLWELGNKDPRHSELLLQFLLWLGHRETILFSLATRASVRSRLCAFFWLVHPSKGEIAGPWSRLTDGNLRGLALDIAALWVDNIEDDLAIAVAKAVQAEEAYRDGWNRLSSSTVVSNA